MIATPCARPTASDPAAEREPADDEALGRFVQRHARYLVAVASRRLSQKLQPKVAAEDLVQETLWQAFRHGRHLETWGVHRQRAWLRRVLGNQLADAHRRYCQAARRSILREVGWEPSVERLIATGGNDRELADWIETLLAELKPAHREVLRLRYWEGRSFVEIAQRYRLSVRAARRLWFTALAQLRRQAAREGLLGPHG